MSDKIIYIYSLIDPRDNRIRYIGKTNNLKRRLLQHTKSKELLYNTFKNHWIKKLISLSLSPIIQVIEECDETNWQEKERYWIAYYRNIYTDLTNGTDGGENPPIKPGELNFVYQKYGKLSHCYGIKRKNSTSEYLGVNYDNSRKKWSCGLTYMKNRYQFGRFDDEIEAALCYDSNVIKFINEPKLNFPEFETHGDR